jgi:hypothetical protein
MRPDCVGNPALRRLPASNLVAETIVSLWPQQNRGRAIVGGETAAPTVTVEGHGARLRAVGSNCEACSRERLTQVVRNLGWRWSGNDDCYIVRLIDLRCDNGCTRQRELLNRSIEEAELGEGRAVGRNGWWTSRRWGRRRRAGVARGTSATSHEDANKKRCSHREPVRALIWSCSRNADARSSLVASWKGSRIADARSSPVDPHALQGSVRLLAVTAGSQWLDNVAS